MEKKPNILFIQVDQLTALALRPYGDRVCHAPHLDALADQGVVFENAYCNTPLCGPSRGSMATGQLASRAGTFDNAAELPAEIPTYAHYLRHAGYQTALSGKMHFIGPDQFHGFEKRLTADIYPADFSWVPNWQDEGKRDTNDARAVRISGPCQRNVQMDFDEGVTQAAVQHLYDMARSGDDRPFFLQVSYTHPHDPFMCRQEFWDLYEGVDLPMPRVPALGLPDHDPHSLRLLKDFGMLGAEFSDEEISRVIRSYYGAISYIDAEIGKVLQALQRSGAAENTVIVFTSDHGEMLGERGLWLKKHFFERSLRVPLFITGPDIAPGRVSGLCSLVDLLPTFAGFAGVTEFVEPLDGVDLGPFMTQGNAQPDRRVYAEYLAETTPVPIFMIRQGQFKFISSSADGEMLFDLAADPTEITNLADDPAYAELVEQFRAEVKAKWDEAAITARIRLSQKRRLLIRDATAQGQPQTWNHGETAQDQVRWYRGQQGYNEWAFDHL